MKKIMILAGRYLPGYKDGGPVRTIKNLTDSIGDKYKFSIVCNDRDHGDVESYSNVKINDFNTVGNAQVYYVKDGRFSFRLIKELANNHDLLYVCGPYNDYAIKALMLNKLGMIKVPFVLAPMGSFSKGALALKSTKKKVFLSIFNTLGLFKRVYFSVTSDVEERELREALGIENKCYVAEDMPRKPIEDLDRDYCKTEDGLRIVFISRICEKKNLSMAIDALSNINEAVSFDIYGNIEDSEYWENCKGKLNNLPINVKWAYKGELDSESVVEKLTEYDVFLFPTLGENFGHVISEAMSAGCIPVISDTTPWLDLNEKQAGYVIPLYKNNGSDEYNIDAFTKTITDLSHMPIESLTKISNNAKTYSINKYNDSVNNNGYMEMFNELIR